MKVFVDCDADLRLIRRILRDMTERGRRLDGIIQQYMRTVKKAHDEFVEPSKRQADIVIMRGKENTIGISTLVAMIKKHLS